MDIDRKAPEDGATSMQMDAEVNMLKRVIFNDYVMDDD